MGSDASDSSSAGSPPAPADHKHDCKAPGSDKGASKKRSDSTTTTDGAAQKVTKRRAARACVSCRARKVRCNVVEEAPCTNCRFDNVEVRCVCGLTTSTMHFMFPLPCPVIYANLFFILLLLFILLIHRSASFRKAAEGSK